MRRNKRASVWTAETDYNVGDRADSNVQRCFLRMRSAGHVLSDDEEVLQTKAGRPIITETDISDAEQGFSDHARRALSDLLWIL